MSECLCSVSQIDFDEGPELTTKPPPITTVVATLSPLTSASSSLVSSSSPCDVVGDPTSYGVDLAVKLAVRDTENLL